MKTKDSTSLKDDVVKQLNQLRNRNPDALEILSNVSGISIVRLKQIADTRAEMTDGELYCLRAMQ